MQKMSINRVILVGRVGAMPSTRVSKSGISIASFSLATNEIIKKTTDQKIEHTEWHNIITIGNQADFVSEYIKKGQLISIEGRLRTSKWENNDNITRYKTEVYADSITPLEWRNDEDTKITNKTEINSESNNDEEKIPF